MKGRGKHVSAAKQQRHTASPNTWPHADEPPSTPPTAWRNVGTADSSQPRPDSTSKPDGAKYTSLYSIEHGRPRRTPSFPDDIYDNELVITTTNIILVSPAQQSSGGGAGAGAQGARHLGHDASSPSRMHQHPSGREAAEEEDKGIYGFPGRGWKRGGAKRAGLPSSLQFPDRKQLYGKRPQVDKEQERVAFGAVCIAAQGWQRNKKSVAEAAKREVLKARKETADANLHSEIEATVHVKHSEAKRRVNKGLRLIEGGQRDIAETMVQMRAIREERMRAKRQLAGDEPGARRQVQVGEKGGDGDNFVLSYLRDVDGGEGLEQREREREKEREREVRELARVAAELRRADDIFRAPSSSLKQQRELMHSSASTSPQKGHQREATISSASASSPQRGQQRELMGSSSSSPLKGSPQRGQYHQASPHLGPNTPGGWGAIHLPLHVLTGNGGDLDEIRTPTAAATAVEFPQDGGSGPRGGSPQQPKSRHSTSPTPSKPRSPYLPKNFDLAGPPPLHLKSPPSRKRTSPGGGRQRHSPQGAGAEINPGSDPKDPAVKVAHLSHESDASEDDAASSQMGVPRGRGDDASMSLANVDQGFERGGIQGERSFESAPGESGLERGGKGGGGLRGERSYDSSPALSSASNYVRRSYPAFKELKPIRKHFGNLLENLLGNRSPVPAGGYHLDGLPPFYPPNPAISAKAALTRGHKLKLFEPVLQSTRQEGTWVQGHGGGGGYAGVDWTAVVRRERQRKATQGPGRFDDGADLKGGGPGRRLSPMPLSP